MRVMRCRHAAAITPLFSLISPLSLTPLLTPADISPLRRYAMMMPRRRRCRYCHLCRQRCRLPSPPSASAGGFISFLRHAFAAARLAEITLMPPSLSLTLPPCFSLEITFAAFAASIRQLICLITTTLRCYTPADDDATPEADMPAGVDA